MAITLMMHKAFHYDEKADTSLIPQSMMNFDRPAIQSIKDVIKEKIKKNDLINKIYLLEGRTGSGKSTYLVSELYREFIKINKKNSASIMVVEPKVILTQSNSVNICRNNPDIIMGQDIGYLSGSFKLLPEGDKNMQFMTTEIFKQKLINAINSKKYLADIVILDEVHILDLPMISLLNIVYNFLKNVTVDQLDKVPIFILTSATININMLASYFSTAINLPLDKIYLNPLLIGYVAGKRNFDVENRFISRDVHNIVAKLNKDDFFKALSKWMFDICIPLSNESKSKIKVKNPNNTYEIQCRDILLFCPTTKPFEIIGSELKKLIKEPSIFVDKLLSESEFQEWRNKNKGKKRYLIMGYSSGYSNLSNELLKFPIDPSYDAQMHETKIILSTPAIETGKTISQLYICVDTGLQFQQLYTPLTYNPNAFYGQLAPISKDSITQRMGRVGRESPGISIGFYTQNAYNKLQNEPTPDNLNSVSLAHIYVDNFNIIMDDKRKNLKIKNKYVNSRIDLIHENNYIVPNAIDILIKTGQDLISCFYLNPIGNIFEFNNDNGHCNSWLIYAKYLYYVMGKSLFEACFIARLNRKFLPVIITPSNFKQAYNFEILDRYDTLDDAMKNEIIEAIKEAKMAVNTLKYDPRNSPFIKLN